eukprot:gene26915-6736_t
MRHCAAYGGERFAGLRARDACCVCGGGGRRRGAA